MIKHWQRSVIIWIEDKWKHLQITNATTYHYPIPVSEAQLDLMGFRNPQLGKVLDSERKGWQCDLDVKRSAAISFEGEEERFATFCSKIDSLTRSAAPPSSQFPPTEESWAMLSYLPPGPFSPPPPPPPRTKSRSVVPPPPPPLPARRSIAADVERRRAPLPVSPSLENKHHHPQKINRDKSSQWQTFCRYGLIVIFWRGCPFCFHSILNLQHHPQVTWNDKSLAQG